jgi:hypothetical protein
MAKNRILILFTLATFVVQSFLFCSHPDRRAPSGNRQTRSWRSLSSPFSLSVHSHTPEKRKLLLLIIDFDDFMCMNCLESFLVFCRSIPDSILEERAWGILIIGSTTGQTDGIHSVKIARKKLKGFVEANGIPFPILIDQHQIFEQFKKKGTAVLAFDERKGSVREYRFPLNEEQISEIHSFVSEY